jgi:hypothetical protein
VDWWDWYDEYSNKTIPEDKPKEGDLPWDQTYCNHAWKATVLIISTVYDCSKCGIKKEDFEKWQKNKK